MRFSCKLVNKFHRKSLIFDNDPVMRFCSEPVLSFFKKVAVTFYNLTKEKLKMEPMTWLSVQKGWRFYNGHYGDSLVKNWWGSILTTMEWTNIKEFYAITNFCRKLLVRFHTDQVFKFSGETEELLISGWFKEWAVTFKTEQCCSELNQWWDYAVILWSSILTLLWDSLVNQW